MKKIFIALFLIGITQITHAQNTLSGKVTDDHNAPVFGADVYIEDLQKGTSTDENGFYKLTNIPNGKHTVIFSIIGYETQQKDLSLYHEDKVINTKLSESVFHMDEVIVSTPFNKLQSENVMKVEHKSMQSLQKSGGVSLIESIETMPGVSNSSTGTGIGKPVIRGLSGNRVLTYTQGVRLENYQFGEKHGLGINESGIEGVEVIKGPASLLYGSDALGGILYLIPEKYAANNTTRGDVGTQFFSNTLGLNTSAGVKTSGDNWKFLMRGAYDTHSDYKTGNHERVTNSRYHEKDLKAGIGFKKNTFTSDLRYNFNQSLIGIPGEIGDQETDKEIKGPYQKINYHIISIKNDFNIKSSSFKTNIGYTHNNRMFYKPDQKVVDMVLSTFNYDAKWFLPKFNHFETVFGIQGMHQTNTNREAHVFLPDAKINDFGIFGNMNYNWEKSTLQAGIRFDDRSIRTEVTKHSETEAIDKKLNNFSGSVGYKINLSEGLITRINIASGFRAPNLSELASNGFHEGRWEIGNSKLKNEQNTQFDLSLEFKNKHLEIFANGFYNNINDFIYLAPTGHEIDDYDVFTYLQDNAYLYGGEMGIHFHPHPLDWLHLESNFQTVIGKQKNGDYLPRIPANRLDNTLRAEFDVSGKIDFGYVYLNLESTFKQDKISEFEDPSDAYNLLNFGLGGNILFGKTKANINLTVKNILNKTYISHLSVLKEDDIPNPGINFVLKAKFSL